MFRKYTLLTAAVLLASAINTPYAKADRLFTTKQDAIPTSRTIYSTQRHSNATFELSETTSAASSSTFEVLYSSLEVFNPTEFPQLALLSASSRQQVASPGHDYTTQSVLMQEQIMMNLLNQDRKINGLAPLTPDEELSRIARIKSADMRDKGYFAHESPTYGNVRAMLKHFGYPYAAAGENIAHHANVDKAQAAFMSSKGHRANILSRAWTKVGVGIVFDRHGYIYATQIFAR